MPERCVIRVDGADVEVAAGGPLAVALLARGVTRFRTSASGEPRSPICAMGICLECRVTIDGVPHRRACLEPCAPGMVVETGAVGAVPAAAVAAAGHEPLRARVAVVGAGPAGLAAACAAAKALRGGADVVVLDEGFAAGGQIWRHRAGSPPPPGAAAYVARLERLGVRVLPGATVVDARDGGRTLLVETRGGSLVVRTEKLVVATGARERFLPFPGWTLPGVMGVGAAQALLKSGLSFRGKRVVIAGTGPLLLPVAALMAKDGAQLAVVAEQAPLGRLLGFAAGLAGRPGKLVEALAYRARFAGVRYRTGTWVTGATGDDRVREVTLTDGARSWSVPCDVLCCAYGLVPNVELARLLGCAVEDGRVRVDARQATSVPDVLSAGEPTGVAGLEASLAEGEIAGLAAAGRVTFPGALLARRDAGRGFAHALETAFRLRDELLHLAAPDTVVCRCEDVRRGDLDPAWSTRQAKLCTRAGMGPCQGRVCGPALGCLFGWEADVVRPPVKTASVGSLAGGTIPPPSTSSG